MKILLTGAAGDFGTDLAPWLAREHEVTLTDARPLETDLPFLRADLTDPDEVSGLCSDMDAVIHLAALLPKDQYRTQAYLEANAAAVALLAEEAVWSGVSRFIYVSTVWATGHGAEECSFMIDEDAPPQPICMYGLTKYMGEIAIEYYSRKHNLPTTILRACGYLRAPNFDTNGEINWPEADLAGLASRLTSPAAKLYNPGDLGPLFESVLRRAQPGSERFLVGLSLPFSSEDADLCRNDPLAAWEKHYPGAAACLQGLGHEPPPFTHCYDNRRSRGGLGFEMHYGLEDVIAEWQRRQ